MERRREDMRMISKDGREGTKSDKGDDQRGIERKMENKGTSRE
jgi:hypothetical protein